MSLHVLNAGTGYQYYTSETASADVLRDKDRQLGDYYTAHGLPPGRWIGSGIAALGLSGNVTEEQMANLYGQGLHPERERVVAEKLAAGWTQENAEKAAKLGRAYYKYEAKNTVLGGLIREREDAFMRMNHRPPNALEKKNIRATEAAILFRSEHGRNPVNKEELGRFITSQLRPQQEAVAGFDLTFTPVKSVSVLWAVGGEDARKLVEQAQDFAVASTIEFLEKHAIATRKGTNGIAQESIESGVIAASFRHYDSREGDPNIHDHVVIANKVQDSNGHWKTIDSKLLHRMAVAASEHYNAAGQRFLQERGVKFLARETEPGKQPVMEIDGIAPELIKLFSKRSQSIAPILNTLVDDYETRRGHAPNPAALLKLAQAANLETRPEKSHAKSLEEHGEGWVEEAHTEVDPIQLQRAMEFILTGEHQTTTATLDMDAAIVEIMAEVTDKRSTFSAQHVLAQAERWTKEHEAAHGLLPADTAAAITATALDTHAISLTPANPYSDFKPLNIAFGDNTFEHATTARYTSAAIIKDENYLIRAGRREVIPAASMENFDAAVDHYNNLVAAGEKHALDPAQLALAREFATSPQLLSVGLGAAGTGKSTVMALVKDAVDMAGGNVIALGPSAVAAGVLGEELGITATTIDMFVLASGPTGRKDLRVTPGTVVIIDEAGMAGTAKLARAVETVEAGGGVVRLVGDPYQHSAVQAGGAMSLLVSELGATELDTVHRFRTIDADGNNVVNAGEAAASQALRVPVAGEANPFQWYLDNGRIKAGDAATMEALAFTRWQSLTNENKPAIIMANTNDQARRLSEQAQTYRHHTGHIDATTPGVELRDGTTARAGDIIVTRLNDRKRITTNGLGTVRNGDLWEVDKTHADGTLSVTHQGTGGRIRLPADYIQANVHLGYALTGNRGQGMTKEHGIPLADSATTRSAMYPNLTRGKYSNELFLILAPGETRDEALAKIAANHGIEESAHAAMASEYARINDLGAMAAQYRHVDAIANTLRMEHLAREVLGDAAGEFTTAESFGAVATHLARAEDLGWDPAVLLKSAYEMREFETAEDNAAVLAWRIETLMDQAPGLISAREGKRPLAGLTDAQLAAQLAAAEARTVEAETVLATDRTMHGPHPENHWTNRTFGHLSDQALETRLSNARLQARTDIIINDPKAARKNAWEIRTLTNEIKIRAGLPPEQWAAETVARGSGMRAYGRPDAGHKERLWQAKNIAAALRAEERYRTHTPLRSLEDARPAVTDGLPGWLAPARAVQDQRTPEIWAAHLSERRALLAARHYETGHQLALETPDWAQALGPVPAREDLNQAWRETAAEIHAFRIQYKVPETETTPVPERFREQELGADLHTRAVTMSQASHNSHPAAAEQLHAAAAEATRTAAHAHAGPSAAKMLSDMERREQTQEAAQPPAAPSHSAEPASTTEAPERRGPEAGMDRAGTQVIAPPAPQRTPTVHLEQEQRPLEQAPAAARSEAKETMSAAQQPETAAAPTLFTDPQRHTHSAAESPTGQQTSTAAAAVPAPADQRAPDKQTPVPATKPARLPLLQAQADGTHKINPEWETERIVAARKAHESSAAATDQGATEQQRNLQRQAAIQQEAQGRLRAAQEQQAQQRAAAQRQRETERLVPGVAGQPAAVQQRALERARAEQARQEQQRAIEQNRQRAAAEQQRQDARQRAEQQRVQEQQRRSQAEQVRQAEARQLRRQAEMGGPEL